MLIVFAATHHRQSRRPPTKPPRSAPSRPTRSHGRSSPSGRRRTRSKTSSRVPDAAPCARARRDRGRDAGRRLPRARVASGRTGELSVGTIRLSRLPRPQGRARHLRAARRLGRALRGDPAARAPARRPPDGRPRRRQDASPTGGQLDVQSVRKDARDAIATYLRNLVLLVFLCGGSLGVLVAFAVRGGATPKLRYTTGRGRSPPRCSPPSPSSSSSRRAARSTRRSTTPSAPTSRARSRRSRPRSARTRAPRPGARRAARRPRPPRHRARPTGPRSRTARGCTLASDLHNNVARAPDPRAHRRRRPGLLRRRPDRPRQPDRGRARHGASSAPASRSCSSRATTTPTTLARQLARDGAIVLTRTGRLSANGRDDRSPDRQRRRACASPATTTRSSASAGEDFADRYDRTPDAVGDRALRDLDARRSATTSTSSWSTTRRCSPTRSTSSTPSRRAQPLLDPRRPHPPQPSSPAAPARP